MSDYWSPFFWDPCRVGTGTGTVQVLYWYGAKNKGTSNFWGSNFWGSNFFHIIKPVKNKSQNHNMFDIRIWRSEKHRQFIKKICPLSSSKWLPKVTKNGFSLYICSNRMSTFQKNFFFKLQLPPPRKLHLQVIQPLRWQQQQQQQYNKQLPWKLIVTVNVTQLICRLSMEIKDGSAPLIVKVNAHVACIVGDRVKYFPTRSSAPERTMKSAQ